jgi:hypothetical protein
MKLIVNAKGCLEPLDEYNSGDVIESNDCFMGNLVYSPTNEETTEVMMTVFESRNRIYRNVCAYALGKFLGDKEKAIQWLIIEQREGRC